MAIEGFVDHDGYNAIDLGTRLTETAMERKEFTEATKLWGKTEYVILNKTGSISFYNVLLPQVDEQFNTRSGNLHGMIFEFNVSYISHKKIQF